MTSSETDTITAISLRSRVGLYGANFFLTEMVGVVAPFLGVFLKKNGWSYDEIGVASAIFGLGTLLFQIPSGVIADEFPRRRFLLGLACILFGLCNIAIPFLPGSTLGVESCLFAAAAAYAFFVPVAAALGLSLAGQKRFGSVIGSAQGWSHAGNIAAAAAALVTVRLLGVESVFYTVAAVCVFATVMLMCIRARELHPLEQGTGSRLKAIGTLFKDRRVIILVASVALFQIANAPAMPLAALYMQHLEGNENRVAWIVLAAQTIMVPVSIIGARLSIRYGRKPVFAVAFIILPLRLILFALTQNPDLVIAVQALDGFCAGIYDVIICIVCADLTRGKAGFNTLLSLMQTTVALGGFAGPLMQGYVTEHLGFPATFLALAAVAVVGAFVFLVYMPETREKQPAGRSEHEHG